MTAPMSPRELAWNRILDAEDHVAKCKAALIDAEKELVSAQGDYNRQRNEGWEQKR